MFHTNILLYINKFAYYKKNYYLCTVFCSNSNIAYYQPTFFYF